MNQDLLCCQYNEEYDLLAAGSCDSVLNLYRSDTGEFVSSFCDDELLANVAPVTGIKHRPVSKNYPVNKCFTCTCLYLDSIFISKNYIFFTITIDSNGFVKCWNYNFNRCVYTIRENRQTFGITYHPRQPKFVTYGDDCKLYLYDEERKTQERILSHRWKRKVYDYIIITIITYYKYIVKQQKLMMVMYRVYSPPVSIRVQTMNCARAAGIIQFNSGICASHLPCDTYLACICAAKASMSTWKAPSC